MTIKDQFNKLVQDCKGKTNSVTDFYHCVEKACKTSDIDFNYCIELMASLTLDEIKKEEKVSEERIFCSYCRAELTDMQEMAQGCHEECRLAIQGYVPLEEYFKDLFGSDYNALSEMLLTDPDITELVQLNRFKVLQFIKEMYWLSRDTPPDVSLAIVKQAINTIL